MSEENKQWYHGSEYDLYIWKDEQQQIIEVQFSFDKQNIEKMLIWKANKKDIICTTIDSGEDNVLKNCSPICLYQECDPGLKQQVAKTLQPVKELEESDRGFIYNIFKL
jgi:hypothetical protein